MDWSPGVTLHQIKVAAIRKALLYYGGNKIRAAKALGISVTGLRIYVRGENELLDFHRPQYRPPKKKQQESHVEVPVPTEVR